MEDNMQAVGSVLGNLKSMAADMGDEISRQNKQLERIDRKVIIFIFFLVFSFFNFLFYLGWGSWPSNRICQQTNWKVT